MSSKEGLKREERWKCWSCGNWNDSRESTCQVIVTKQDGKREVCGAVRREA